MLTGCCIALYALHLHAALYAPVVNMLQFEVESKVEGTHILIVIFSLLRSGAVANHEQGVQDRLDCLDNVLQSSTYGEWTVHHCQRTWPGWQG